MLQGKNAIVTGARTGIGRSIVEKFVRAGANVWAVVHREDQQWESEMQSLAKIYGVWIRPIFIDLSDQLSITTGMKTIISEKMPIDILVNAAGIVSPNRLIQMTPMDEMQKVMQVNFFAAVQMCQLASRVMCRQKSGSIINISSVSADGRDNAQTEYSASKAAFDVFTRKLSRELGKHGIRVNAVAPGVIETKIHDNIDIQALQTMVCQSSLGRIGKPDEVADVVSFLASADASYITGQILRVDGGL